MGFNRTVIFSNMPADRNLSLDKQLRLLPRELAAMERCIALGRTLTNLFFPVNCVPRRIVAVVASILLLFSGCDRPDEKTRRVPSEVETSKLLDLHLVVLDDARLARAIESEWNSRSERQLIVSHLKSLEFLESLEVGELPRVDLIVYPAALLGELVERQIVTAIPESMMADECLALPDILANLRLREAVWGGQLYASSFGSPTLNLFYRADLFEKLGISPPTTWSEYGQIAEEFSRVGNVPAGEMSESATWFAAAEPLGPSWSGIMLLARAAAYAKHPNNYSTLFRYRSMEPLIAGPPFVRALEELVAAAEFGSPEAAEHTPRDCRRLFVEGQCAMALTWPCHEEEDAQSNLSHIESTAFTELPGSTEVFHIQDARWQERGNLEDPRVSLLVVSGRLISVTTSSRRTSAAFRTMGLLTGSELGSAISPHSDSTMVYRQSQLSDLASWFPFRASSSVVRQYREVVESTQSRVAYLCSLRIPGRSQYMGELDRAVHRALSGEESPGEALAHVAQCWQKITKSLGVEQQSIAYRKSLGLDF